MTTVNCSVCSSTTSTLKKCGKCKEVCYCSIECQKKAWPAHRRYCGGAWWDTAKMRKNEDKSLHYGKLELVTWTTGEFGWGNTYVEEEDLKNKFEDEFQSDEKQLFDYWPSAFRWTCCGNDASQTFGCDHHGTGPKPCTCDFCRMGKPLTDSIFESTSKKQHAVGLNLVKGPDPRSYNAHSALINEMARSAMGMDG
ncbi:hypothetical protein HYFRA_00004819 [Hymenoscyphus fraxineus]|uniref:MYND-type domain-containing protein n=1 Tax=Hymenoscyphus fraxineus TaxID=746836 RepID=A0A9N9KLJ4_9HELO|nr:hypothetical protein HYFRA_00004819 [Hymenoscyphus fraxineus]